MTTHAPGPHVVAKKKIYMQMKEIMAETAGLEVSVTPMMATMNSHTTMPKAPQIMIVLRPNLSMIQNEIGVEQTLTKVVIRLIKNGLLIVPSWVKNVVPK